MKFLFKIVLITMLVADIDVSRADTFSDSLNSAYSTNSKLNAERANMRASREEKRESISEFLPSITISGYRSEQDNTKGNSDDSSFEPKENSMLIEQKIFLRSYSITNNFTEFQNKFSNCRKKFFYISI